jgi:hypothetical protein
MSLARHLRPWAAAMARPAVRTFLIIVTAAMTLVLLPIAGFGALVTISSLSGTYIDLASTAGIGAVAFGGIAGIVAAWARLLLSGPRFQASVNLRLGTAIGLAIGIAVGVALLATFYFGLPHTEWPFWLALAGIAVGIFLAGATLGESD